MNRARRADPDNKKLVTGVANNSDDEEYNDLPANKKKKKNNNPDDEYGDEEDAINPNESQRKLNKKEKDIEH